VTAELAVALPAVALVLTACLWALHLGAQQMRLEDAAGLVARAVARDEGVPDRALAAVGAGTGVQASTWRDGDLVCAKVHVSATGPPGLPPVGLSAKACALDGDG
jgi:hypothetical protein